MSILAPERPATTVEQPAPAEDADAFAILAADLPRGRGGRLAQSVPSALEALRANKGRAVLTALGIIIGVAAVIVMVSLGQGASAQVSARLAGLGTNVLTVNPGSSQSGGVRSGAGTVTSLTRADADAIRTEVPQRVLGPARRPLVPGPVHHRVGVAVDEVGDLLTIGHRCAPLSAARAIRSLCSLMRAPPRPGGAGRSGGAPCR